MKIYIIINWEHYWDVSSEIFINEHEADNELQRLQRIIDDDESYFVKKEEKELKLNLANVTFDI